MSGPEHRRENADDGDDDQQLDQREPADEKLGIENRNAAAMTALESLTGTQGPAK